jgi:hypothetical protein
MSLWGAHKLHQIITSGLPLEYMLGLLGLLIVCEILREKVWEWSNKKNTEKKRQMWGDYEKEALKIFEERYPGNGVGSYEYIQHYADIEKEVIKERKIKRLKERIKQKSEHKE